uniref:SUEL-type lectin domain-containing protein n=1 Tax=Neogobius melanostomus TaxID=47308 RepID=A0A8C6SHG4_9GOBI
KAGLNMFSSLSGLAAASLVIAGKGHIPPLLCQISELRKGTWMGDRLETTGSLSEMECEQSTVDLTCSGKVIRIHSADYGRSDGTTCSEGRPSHEIRFSLSFRCNEKDKCTVKAVNSEFGDPCPGTYKYLQLDFSCVGKSCSVHVI